MGPQLEGPDDEQGAQRQLHPVQQDDGVEVRAAHPVGRALGGQAPLTAGVLRWPPGLLLGHRLGRRDVVRVGDVRVPGQCALRVHLDAGEVADQPLDVEVAEDRACARHRSEGRSAGRGGRPPLG